MKKHRFAPNINTSRILWEELNEKIPDLFLVGIFTLECNYEIDGLGRLYSQQAKRGSYNISSFINSKRMTKSRRVFSPLLAKHMDLIPKITTSQEVVEDEGIVNNRGNNNYLINHEATLSEIRSAWEYVQDNFDTILPRIKVTTYCVERHLISKKHVSQHAGCKTTIQFSTRIQPISSQFSPFYVEKEFSFQNTDYQIIIPEEFKVNTIITNLEADIDIVLSPQASLELIYDIYIKAPNLLLSTDKNDFLVEPDSDKSIISMETDDSGEKRKIEALVDKNKHPLVYARPMSTPLHSAEYNLKHLPVHIYWEGEKQEPPENMVLVEKLGLNADISYQKNQLIVTGYNSYFIREGEIVAFIPQITFSIPRIEKIFMNFVGVSEGVWVSPSDAPFSAELPYFRLKTHKIIN